MSDNHAKQSDLLKLQSQYLGDLSKLQKSFDRCTERADIQDEQNTAFKADMNKNFLSQVERMKKTAERGAEALQLALGKITACEEYILSLDDVIPELRSLIEKQNKVIADLTGEVDSLRKEVQKVKKTGEKKAKLFG